MAAARQAILQLAPDASFAELRAASVNAGQTVASEYVSEKRVSKREFGRSKRASVQMIFHHTGPFQVLVVERQSK